MGLFDQLPATHPARGQLVDLAPEAFLRANRYQDMVNAGHPETSLDQALSLSDYHKAQSKTNGPNDKSREAHTRRRVVETGGWALEAFAAVGQVERATAVADKVLKFDSSPETKGELLKYAQRAGNATVLSHLMNK
jgi:hypothetical protein